MRSNHQLRSVDDVVDLLLQRIARPRQVQDFGDVRRQGEFRFGKPDGMYTLFTPGAEKPWAK